MKRCRKCGNEIVKGHSACPFCGTSYVNPIAVLMTFCLFTFAVIIFSSFYTSGNGFDAFKDIDFQEIENIFNVKSSERAEKYYQEGRAKVLNGKYAEGIRDLNKAIKNKPDDARFYFQRAYANNQIDGPDVIEDYTTAISINPSYHEAYFNRGTKYLNMEKYDLALTDIEKAIELNQGRSDYYFQRGYVKYHLDMYQECIEDFQKSAESEKFKYRSYNYIGLAYFDLKNYKEAIKYLKQAVDIKQDEYSIYLIALSYEKMEKYKEALEYYDKTLEVNPNYDSARINKQELLKKMGQ